MAFFRGFYISLICMVLVSPVLVRAHSDGAPAGSCDNMLPHHDDNTAQTSTPPYSIALSKSSIGAGESIQVTLTADIDCAFEGILLKAISVDSPTYNGIAGTFSIDDGLYRYVDCSDVPMSGITQTTAVNKTSMTATWVSPSYSGQFAFLATFLFNYETFWIVQSSDSVAVTGGTSVPYDYGDCGSTVSCMGKPTGCTSGQNCEVLLTFRPSDGGDGVDFEMLYFGDGYVSVGFSEDEIMGEDSVLECLHVPSGEVIMYASTNDGHHNANAGSDPSYFSLTSGSYSNGALTCSFSRPFSTTVGDITTDLSANQYYILLAVGPLNTDGTDIARHTGRWYSFEPVDLASDTFVIIDGEITTTAAPTAPPTTAPTGPPTTASPWIPYDYSECGESVSCMGDTNNCISDENCNVLLTYHANGDTVDFEIMRVGDGYVAVGFSTDNFMGTDSVLECLDLSTGPSMYASINDGHHNEKAQDPQNENYFTLTSSSYTAGLLKCAFSRPMSTTVNEITTDFTDTNYYLLLAIGPLNDDGTDIDMHSAYCVSSTAVDLSSDKSIIIDGEITTTAAPTGSPTTAPTGPPTTAPTGPPTTAPTGPPTTAPTGPPTTAPTGPPTTAPTGPPTTAPTGPPTTASPFIPYDYSECGESVGCMGDTENCILDENCNVLLTYHANEDTVDFEIMRVGDGYVAVGFSTDNLMGTDSVLECLDLSTGIIMYASINDGRHNKKAQDPTNEHYFTLTSSSYSVGILKCVFFRPMATTVDEITTNFTDTNYYLLLAIGPLNDDGTDIATHSAHWVSSTAVDLSSNKSIIIDGKTVPEVQVMIHGAFMVVAWIMTSSVAVFLARYYKDMWPTKMHCNVKIWFAWHRGLNYVTVILTLVSFILIIVFTETKSHSIFGEHLKRAHPIVGTIAVAFMILQPIGAFFRPDPKDSNRPIFNWLHFCGGMIACICGIVTIFLAVPLENALLPSYFYYILAGYLGFCLLMICSMEIAIRVCHHDKDTAINGDDNKLEIPKVPKIWTFKKIMLALFSCGVTGFAAALIAVICT